MGAGATRTTLGPDELGGPRLRGGFSEPPKPQDTWEDGGAGVYRSQLGPFAACRHTRRQGGPRQQSHVIVAHRDECAPRPSWSFVIRVHKFQKGCCQTYYFLSGVLSPEEQRLQIQQVSCRPRLPYDNNGPCEELELLLLYPHQHIRPLCRNERAPAVIVSGSETYVV